MFTDNAPKKKVIVGQEGITIEMTMLIHLTRMDEHF